MRARTNRLNDRCSVISCSLVAAIPQLTLTASPPDGASTRPASRELEAPLAPASAGGVSAGTGGWAQDGADIHATAGQRDAQAVDSSQRLYGGPIGESSPHDPEGGHDVPDLRMHGRPSGDGPAQHHVRGHQGGG